jgi:hypothetical protein
MKWFRRLVSSGVVLLSKLSRKIIYKGRTFFADQAVALRAREEAGKSMKGLLADGTVALPRSGEVRRIRDYARSVLGSDAYFPWLHFYAAYRGAFLEGWIPDNLFQNVAVKHVNGAYHLADNARTLQRRLLQTPSLPDVAHHVNGEWRDVEGGIIKPSELASVLFQDGDEVCVKTQNSSKGRGVSFERRETFDPARVGSLGNFVVQRVILQNAFFEGIFPHAVATLRISTGMLPGARPHFVGSYLRVGRGRARAVGEGSLRVPVLDAAGRLGDFASDSTWRRFTHHPDTGFRFAGVEVPGFGAALAHCLDLHERLPQFGLVGWDVVLDRAGAVEVMEFNTGHPGIKFIEMSVGPTLKAFNMERYVNPARAA